MTICAIKLCRNYKGRLKTTKKVTFHRIPIDPIVRSKWIDIVRKSRGDDLWQPAKTTVICSDHFRAKDLYFVNNQNRQRLKKKAIPCKALFLTSLETDDDESDGLLEETGKISECETNISDDTKISGSNEEGSFGVTNLNNFASSSSRYTSATMSSNIKDIKSGNTSSHIVGEATASEQIKENKSDQIEDYSDLESLFDTPKKTKLRRELRRKIRLQKIHTLKIQALKRQNLRLKKKIASFKQIIGTLKKRDISTALINRK